VENKRFLLGTGDAFLVPPKVTHKTILCPDSAIISCEVALESLLPPDSLGGQEGIRSYLDMVSMMIFLQDSKSRHPRFVFRPESSQQVGQLMREILTEYQQEQPCYKDMLRAKIQELLLLFVREFIVSPDYSGTDVIYERYRSLMDDVIAYINDHFTEPLTLEDVCKISTLSRTYFCYLFKLMTQKTFVEYLTDLRIQEALKRLDNPSMSILDVSESLGFHDAAHFSRTFKKQVGVSPRNYRKFRITDAGGTHHG